MKTFTLKPIQDDVQKQLKITRELLDVIDKLNKAGVDIDNDRLLILNDAIKTLTEASDQLMDNARQVNKFIREVA